MLLGHLPSIIRGLESNLLDEMMRIMGQISLFSINLFLLLVINDWIDEFFKMDSTQNGL